MIKKALPLLLAGCGQQASQASGTIIFRAAYYHRKSCFIMHEWNGQLSRCTGYSMFILKKIGAALRIAQSNKISTCSVKLLLDLVNAQGLVDGTTAVERFIQRFRLGARIAIEVMNDEDGCLRDIT